MRRIAAVLLLVVAVTGGCALTGGGPVERVDGNDVPYGLDDTIPTTTSSTTTTTLVPPTSTVPPSSTVAAETVELYFIAGGQLVEYPVLMNSPASLPQVLARLQDGVPTGELGRGLRTAVPRAVAISVTDDGSGVATVELPTGFFADIPQTDQRFAIGQLVLSLRGDGIGQIRFTENGAPMRVPVGSGALSEPGQPLSLRDFDELLEDTTPSTSSTTSTLAGTPTTGSVPPTSSP
jgi:hypothetical protein